jgi:hypothetical protein
MEINGGKDGATLWTARIMKNRQRWFVGLMLVMALLAVSAVQAPNQAGLVVRYSDERVETYCVDFEEAEITGYELLQRAGLALEVEQAGMGASICRVDDVGCAASNCFCQCRGGNCQYWSYWQLRDGEWRYAATGASINKVASGDVQGWSWGLGSVNEAIAPPAVTFDEVCAAESGAQVATTTAPASDDGAVSIDGAPTPSATVLAAREAEDSISMVPSLALALGLVVVVVLAGALVASQRRRQ